MAFTTYKIEGDSFRQSLETAKLVARSLKEPLTEIGQDWFNTNTETFTLSSAGPYKDLTDVYKARKQKKHGFIYPILQATGKLGESITNPNDSNAIFKIKDKELEIGTKLYYGIFHQEGTSKMPRRPFLFVGGPFAVGAQKGRARRWVAILDKFISEKLAKV